MRTRSLVLTLLAVAALLAAAYGVVDWLDSDAPNMDPSASRRVEPASPPVSRDSDLQSRPPTESTDPQVPERTEAPSPRPEPAPATVHLHGTVTLFEHLDVDSPLPPPDGTFDLAVLTSAATLHQKVTVQGGDFEVEVPPSSELEVRTFQFGGRVAWIRGESRRSIPDDGRFDFIVTCLASRLLDVVDAKDGSALEDVVVLVATTPDEHPGIPRACDRLIDRKPSPVELAPFFSRIAARDRVAAHTPLWVGARNHAFRRIELDFDRGSNRCRVALDLCGSLTVHLRGDTEFLKCALWLRLTARREQALYLASHATFNEPVRIDGVRAGEFEVDVVRGSRSNARSYGGTVAEVESGRDTEVTIDVSQPPAFEAASLPITGTIEIPAAWGMLHEMFLWRVDAPEIDELRVELGDLPLERADPRTLRFQTSTRAPGLWRASINANNRAHFGGNFFVGPEGATDLRFAIGEPAELTVVYKDAGSGALLRRSQHPFVYASWVSTNAMELAWDHEDSLGSFRLSFDAPIGPIRLRSECEGFAPLTEEFRVQPGANQHVSLLRLPIGIEVEFTLDGKHAAPDAQGFPIALRFLDGQGASLDSVDHDSWWRVYVGQPGRYEVTVLPLEGYLPIKPFDVNLQVGKLQRVDIPLTKRP